MIQFITRKKVFETNATVAFEISTLQKAMFEDDIDLFENEQNKSAYEDLFDCKDLITEKVERFYKVLSFDHAEIKTFTKIISEKLVLLLTAVEIKKLIVVAHLKQNLFGANLQHKYPPVKKAFNNLEKITQSRNYKEAFKIDIEDLTAFIEIFFWIERCDASVPEYVFFFDEANRFAFNLCKDGNVHTIEFDREILSDSLLKEKQWYTIDGRCFDNFSKDGKIKGRITNT